MFVPRKLVSPPPGRTAEDNKSISSTEPGGGGQTSTTCSEVNGTAGGCKTGGVRSGGCGNGIVGGMSILRAVEGNAAAMSSLFPGI